jgi:hypothetical protein
VTRPIESLGTPFLLFVLLALPVAVLLVALYFGGGR